jgi:hypothetical protein
MEQIELKDFLEKFLPDYEAKLKESMGVMTSIFAAYYFPEAQQNFMDKFGEAQRENCATAWDEYDSDNTEYLDASEAILHAEQPKISDIT